MEAYYHKDPKIEEWVNQIIEKIFTTCLLTGADADAEYQRGCQIVEKLAFLLKGFSTFPSEYLEDGLKQMLEQQLPDSRVINNFPSFQDIMNKMLKEGIITFNNENVGESHLDHLDNPKEKLEEDLGKDQRLQNVIVATNELLNNHIDFIEEGKRFNELAADIKPEIKSDNPIPVKALRLNNVLSYIFPNVPVRWNINLKGQKFLARVENLLIYCYDSVNPLKTEIFKKDGWKVIAFREEDLTYPRRLEREIKTIMRIGRKS